MVTEKTRWYECLGQKLVRTIQKAFSFANHFHVNLRLRWKDTIKSGKPPYNLEASVFIINKVVYEKFKEKR